MQRTLRSLWRRLRQLLERRRDVSVMWLADYERRRRAAGVEQACVASWPISKEGW